MRKLTIPLFVTLLLVSVIIPATSYAIIPDKTASTVPGDPTTLAAKAALKEFMDLSRKDKKMRFKSARKEIKALKAARRSGDDAETNTILLAILAILLPPLAVYLYEHDATKRFWITLVLFVLGITGALFFSTLFLLAAIVYALIVILGGS